MKMVDLYHDLTTTSKDMAKVPFPVPPAMESFKKMTDGHSALQFAALGDVYRYLRGNRRLSIPDNWRPYFLKTLEPEP